MNQPTQQLPLGYRFADGAAVIACEWSWTGWRAMVYWPYDETIGAARFHDWCVCTIDDINDTGEWVRHSSLFMHTRAEAETAYHGDDRVAA